MTIIGIDPGPERSAYAHVNNGEIETGECDNTIRARHVLDNAGMFHGVTYAIEDFVPYGKSLGHESMQTIKAIGVLTFVLQTAGVPVLLIPRPEIKLHLCGTRTAKDADVRDALIHRYGPGRDKAVGTKKQPGPLYGITSHGWAALAVAVVAMDRIAEQKVIA